MGTFNAGTIDATLTLDRDPFQRDLAAARQQAARFAGETHKGRLELDTAEAHAALARLRADLTAWNAQAGGPTIQLDTSDLQSDLRDLRAELAALGNTITTHGVRVDDSQAQRQITELRAELAILSQTRTDVSVGVDTRRAHASMSALMPLILGIAPALAPIGVVGVGVFGALATAAIGAGGALGLVAAAMGGNIAQALAAQAAMDQAAGATTGAGTAATGAAEAVKAAEEKVTTAQEAAQDAQEELNQARRDGVIALKELSLQLRGAALDEEGAELAVRQAYVALQKTLSDPEATDLERDKAQHAYDEAILRLDEVRLEGKKTREDVRRQTKDGVESLDTVKAAKEQLAAAEKSVADAQKQATAARQAAAAATAAYAAATADLSGAMVELDAPARDFLAALNELNGSWNEFLDETDDATLGAAADFLRIIAEILPIFVPAANAVAESVGGIVDEFGEWATGGGAQAVADWLEEYGPTFLTDLALGFGAAAIGLGHLLDAFSPFAEKLTGKFRGAMREFAEDTKNLDGNPNFVAFMERVQELGPEVGDLFGNMGDAALNILNAVAPWGEFVLPYVSGFFEVIAEADPMLLAIGIGALAVAFGLMAGGVGGVIALVAGVGIAFTSLYENSETFRKAWDGLYKDVLKPSWEWLQEKSVELWNDTLKPGLADIKDLLVDDLIPAWNDLWETAEPGFDSLMKFLGGKAFANGKAQISGLIDLVKGIIKAITGVITFVDGVAEGDWKKAFRGLKDIGAGQIEILGGLMQTTLGSSAQWVIDVVWNDGLRAMWNDVNNLWGGKDIPAFSFDGDKPKKQSGPRNKFSSDIMGYSDGGTVPGYAPRQDTVPAMLSPGEGILVPEAVRGLGGPAWINAINRRFRSGVQWFADGGVVWPAKGAVTQHPRSQYPWAAWSGDINQPGAADLGAPVWAYRDGTVSSVQSWDTSYGHHIRLNHGDAQTLYAHLSRMYVEPGERVKAGEVIGAVGSTGNSSGPHLHFEITGAAGAIGGPTGSGSVPAFLAGITDEVLDFARSPFASLRGLVDDKLDDMPYRGLWADGLGDLMGVAAGRMAGKVSDLASGPLGMLAGKFDNGGALQPGWTLAYNGTGRPENVRTAEQEDRATALLEAIVDLLSRGGGPGGVTIQTVPGATAQELMDAWSFENRRQERGGVYV